MSVSRRSSITLNKEFKMIFQTTKVQRDEVETQNLINVFTQYYAEDSGINSVYQQSNVQSKRISAR